MCPWVRFLLLCRQGRCPLQRASHPVLSFPIGSWCVKLHGKAVFPAPLFPPSICLFFYAFVKLSVAHRCQVVSCFPLPSTNFSIDTAPILTIVQTWATEVKTQLYGLIHVVFFKDVCLILVLFRFVIMHACNILILIFLSVPSLCFTSVTPCSKALTLFMVQIQVFQIDMGSLFEMACGLSIGWVGGNSFI